MATFNGAKFIREQLESILPQLSPDDEIIISDDSSTDETLGIIRSFYDARIVILEGRNFKNPVRNFENALGHSRGSYIFLCDQDDVWLEGRVAKMCAALEEFDLVLSDCRIVDQDLSTIHPSYFALVHARPGFLRNLVLPSSYVGCCMAFRSEVLQKALPFPKGIPMHDFWIALIAELKFRVTFLDEQLLLYRRHADNASSTASKSKNTLYKKLSLRLATLYLLGKHLLG
jgi:glycosyltransferase involved in cell wall biosynthesis